MGEHILSLVFHKDHGKFLRFWETTKEKWEGEFQHIIVRSNKRRFRFGPRKRYQASFHRSRKDDLVSKFVGLTPLHLVPKLLAKEKSNAR